MPLAVVSHSAPSLLLSPRQDLLWRSSRLDRLRLFSPRGRPDSPWAGRLALVLVSHQPRSAPSGWEVRLGRERSGSRRPRRARPSRQCSCSETRTSHPRAAARGLTLVLPLALRTPQQKLQIILETSHPSKMQPKHPNLRKPLRRLGPCLHCKPMPPLDTRTPRPSESPTARPTASRMDMPKNRSPLSQNARRRRPLRLLPLSRRPRYQRLVARDARLSRWTG